MLHPLHPKRLIWLVIAIACAALATHLAVGLAADVHNEAYLYDDRISRGEKGWDLEIYDGQYIAIVFAFPDRLVRHHGPKTPDAPEGWAYDRKIETLTYYPVREAVDFFIDEIDRRNPDFKIVRGQNSPTEPRHFTVNIHDPDGDRKAIEIKFIGNRAETTIHNGYQTTGNTDFFLDTLKSAIKNRRIIKG